MGDRRNPQIHLCLHNSFQHHCLGLQLDRVCRDKECRPLPVRINIPRNAKTHFSLATGCSTAARCHCRLPSSSRSPNLFQSTKYSSLASSRLGSRWVASPTLVDLLTPDSDSPNGLLDLVHRSVLHRSSMPVDHHPVWLVRWLDLPPLLQEKSW